MQVRKKLVGCPMVPFKTPIKFKTTLNNTKCRQLLFLWHSGHHLLHPKCHANFNWLSQLPAWRTDTGKMWPFPKWKLIPTSRTPTPNGGDGFYWPSVWRLLAGLGFFSNSNRLKWNFPHKPKVEVGNVSGGVTKRHNGSMIYGKVSWDWGGFSKVSFSGALRMESWTGFLKLCCHVEPNEHFRRTISLKLCTQENGTFVRVLASEDYPNWCKWKLFKGNSAFVDTSPMEEQNRPTRNGRQ